MIGENWYYEFDGEEYSDKFGSSILNHVWLVSKPFWNQHNYFDDQHLGDMVVLPFESDECQESLFEFYCSIEEADRLLQENGFTRLMR